MGRTEGAGAAFRDLENYPLASQCPNLPHASLSGRYSPGQLLAEQQPRCKADADHLASAIRGERIVRAVLDEEACTRERCRSLRRAASKPRRVSAGWHGRRERCAAESWSVLDEEEAGRHKSPSVEPAVRSPATALRSRAASLSTAQHLATRRGTLQRSAAPASGTGVACVWDCVRTLCLSTAPSHLSFSPSCTDTRMHAHAAVFVRH